ncbi:uncharacterized protein [Amphiura filiformis]|uniref:uncharacterized protein n=1 Tax=Amphiura filiformis TaxID=82378 RepID=UPI003B2120D7
METSNQTRVILWSVPRSTSTAFEMCMSNVKDSVIWHEPFLCAMWFGTDRRFPPPGSDGCAGDKGLGFESQARSIQLDVTTGYDAYQSSYSWAKSELEKDYSNKRLVFCKGITYAIATRFDAIPDGYRHTFLIRHPYKVLPSWKKLFSNGLNVPLEDFRMDELPVSSMPPGHAFKESYDLLQHVKQHYEANPIIIDADDLLSHPEEMMKHYCEAVNIPYSKDLLRWESGEEVVSKWMIPTFFIQGNRLGGWYDSAFASSGWQKTRPTPSRSELSADVLSCADAIMPYYDEMYKQRLIPQ